ncbi:hypothetical protein SAMN06265373_10582 [Shimia sagamensis]|uniref:Transposase n=1 Tax=Shimia sagamensis TaxID=1566352 RepID=A0ABY1P4G2_9RHOB|nr:hypothetical protein SAMN06265373_10582 [Shimia sagamensis]
MTSPFVRKSIGQVDPLPLRKNKQETEQVCRLILKVLPRGVIRHGTALCPLCGKVGRLQLPQLLSQFGKIPCGIPINAKPLRIEVTHRCRLLDQGLKILGRSATYLSLGTRVNLFIFQNHTSTKQLSYRRNTDALFAVA